MKKDLIYWVVIILLLLGGGFSAWQWQRADKALKAARSEQGILSDNLSELRKTVEVLKVSRSEFRNLFLEEQAKLESIDVNPNSIQSITQIHIETKDSILVKEVVRYDTVFVDGDPVVQEVLKSLEHEDEWLSLRIQPEMLGWWSLDYTVRDTIDVVVSAGGGFFRNKYSITGKSSNPNTEIVGVDGLIIDDRKKRWGLGLTVGYGATYTDRVHLAPYVGVGLNYQLVRW
jgi:hypothetical protein